MPLPQHATASSHRDIAMDQPKDLCGVLLTCSGKELAVWQWLALLLNEASRQQADELHIEPDQDCWRLRMRSAFKFTETRIENIEEYRLGLSQLEYSLWDKTESSGARRAWFAFLVNDTEHLVRLDVVPSSKGKTYLLTLQHPLKNPPPRLDELALSREQQLHIRELLKVRNGMLLLACENTQARLTTARALTQELIAPDKKIVCADTPGHPFLPRTTQLAMDFPPTEYQLDSWTAMCQLGCDAIIACQPMTDSAGRQLVRLAAERALVVQSLNANSASNALNSLLAMGVRSEALARTLKAIIVQRQIQRICPYCRVTEVPDDPGTAWLAKHSPIKAGNINDWLRHRMRSSFSNAPGCDRCDNTGQGPALDIYDIVAIDEAVQDALYDADIRYALSLLGNQHSLPMYLLKLAQEGIITLAEAVRVAPLDASNR